VRLVEYGCAASEQMADRIEAALPDPREATAAP
jgi:hypothetical protein